MKIIMAAALTAAILGASADSAKAEWVYRTWHTGWQSRTVWVPRTIWRPYRFARYHRARILYYEPVYGW